MKETITLELELDAKMASLLAATLAQTRVGALRFEEAKYEANSDGKKTLSLTFAELVIP